MQKEQCKCEYTKRNYSGPRQAALVELGLAPKPEKECLGETMTPILGTRIRTEIVIVFRVIN